MTSRGSQNGVNRKGGAHADDVDNIAATDCPACNPAVICPIGGAGGGTGSRGAATGLGEGRADASSEGVLDDGLLSLLLLFSVSLPVG